ncbi:MAG: SGNH/GDSL hydrolase family protein [Deltaproteobacteria bacterium]|nr:SGNH/GDSL hydrolase family protein [Deltaproteobacteria bacterium]
MIHDSLVRFGVGLRVASAVAALLVGLACEGDDPGSSSSTSSGSSHGGSDGGSDLGAGGPGAGGTASSGEGGSSSSTSSGEGGAIGPEGLDDLGTLVVLGDSIGDGGGQGPYYYDLLQASLAAHYGAIDVHREADSGSETSALLGQVNSLPSTLSGPVAVVITSGGNDMKDQLPLVFLGMDDVPIATMRANIDQALNALLAPDAFGAGVAVHVFEATIYDASDGQGNYASGGCVINIDSPTPVDPFFAKWNGAIAEVVAARGQQLAPMHDTFFGHGFNNPPNWYAGDCTHPNTTGHDELHRMFYELIVGDPAP